MRHRIYDPCVGGGVEQAAPGGRARAKKGAQMVLVVEDHPSVRDVMMRVLQDGGFDAVGAKGPNEALALAHGCEPIELLVVDVVLPGMNGPELAGRIRELHPDASVLFVSGYGLEELRDRGVHVIDGQLLEKPFAPAALVDAVHGTLAERVQRGA